MSEYHTVPVNLSLSEEMVDKLGELHRTLGITMSSLVMALLEQPVDVLEDVFIQAHERKIPPLRCFLTSGGKLQRASKHSQPIVRDYLVSLGQFNARKADIYNRKERNYE